MNKKIILSLLASSFLFANNIEVPTNGSDLKITIYSSNLAFINDSRTVNVEKGKHNLVYQGVPKNVISESVIPTFLNIPVSLYSQNYMYDLISRNSMLIKSIDNEVEYINNNDFDREEPMVHNGTLLSVSPTMIKRTDGKIITLNNPNQIIFNKIPDNMITKPSLVWEADIGRNGNLNIDLKYLSTGITWKSDYVLNLKENSRLDLNGWISINNNSGVDYNNAQITCLAGEVNRNPIRNNHGGRVMVQKAMMMEDSIALDKEVVEESFSGYHIYKIPFKQDIKNNQKKQIVFIDKKDVNFELYGLATNSYFGNYGKQKLSFNKIIEFKNEKENNLGIPLPQGSIRMYQKDKSGETHFIGENRIGNIPNKETIKLKVGTLFDVVGEKKITKFNVNKFEREIETTYEIKNRGKEDIEVRIKETIPTYGRKITSTTSCSGICSFEKESAFIRIFKVKLKKDSVYSFKTYFEVRN